MCADCYATAAGHPGSYTRNREASLLYVCVYSAPKPETLSATTKHTHTHRGDFELGNPESVLFGKANKRNMLVVRNFTDIHTDASECSAPDQVE